MLIKAISLCALCAVVPMFAGSHVLVSQDRGEMGAAYIFIYVNILHFSGGPVFFVF